MPDLEIPTILKQIQLLLQTHGVESWRGHIARLVTDAENVYVNDRMWAKQQLLDELKELFGGMGSFNDLVISHLNGDRISSEAEPAINERLNELRERLYEALKREKMR